MVRMSDYTVTARTEAVDFMAEYPGFGELRSYTSELEAEQIAFSWRQMPPDTGGRGSYGHRHATQEEVYFVISGTLTFKVGDDVFEAGPGTAVRVAPQALRSVHNDTERTVELVICSIRLAEGPDGDVSTEDDFWPR
jgi:mannose-6-phosphate isomerase-like protein (cupin superfamily)